MNKLRFRGIPRGYRGAETQETNNETLRGAREEAGTVGDETKKKTNEVEGVAAANWVRTYVI